MHARDWPRKTENEYDEYEENDDFESSDSEQDWLEYQEYLRSHYHKPHHTTHAPYMPPVHGFPDDYDEYLKWKQDHEEMERRQETIHKQQEADYKYSKFRREHPYMSEDELKLYHDKVEEEPFFHSPEERDMWKAKKKEEKLLRDQKRSILKHQREIKEIEDAYELILDPKYHGDRDLDHIIEAHRTQYGMHDFDMYHPEPSVPVHHATPVHDQDPSELHFEPTTKKPTATAAPQKDTKPATSKPAETKAMPVTKPIEKPAEKTVEKPKDKQVEKTTESDDEEDWADYQAYLAAHQAAKDKKASTAAPIPSSPAKKPDAAVQAPTK